VSMRGAIILGGPCTQAEVIRTVAEIPLRALILSSITPDLIPAVNQLQMPVLILSGIGKLPMDDVTFKILSTNDKREICVNTAPWNRYNRTRPELVIPLPSGAQLTPPREADIFAPGQNVRLVQSPNKGAIATIVTLRPGLVAFPSGIRALSAILQMGDGEKITIALANLEVIE
jgi:hypothetical protein